MDLQQIAGDVPDYDRFLTIDELNASSHRLVADYPDLASIRVVGQTRRGDPIELLTIKGGDKQAFVFGGPHPNEPIGTLTIEYLSRRLCADAALRDELGYTWHFIKSIDADGMRLNEGWFSGPFTPTNYARHFFRPAAFDQIEWTFPIDYKDLHFHATLPETETLMRVIDEVKPTLLYSLHNAGFGGVYYYVSDKCEPLYDLFHQIPAWYDLALDLGEPEIPSVEQYAPAIYGMISTAEIYDYLEQNGVPNPAAALQSGTSSADYASQYGSFYLVVELPYYDEPRVNDQSLTGTLRRDAIVQGIDQSQAFDDWISAAARRGAGGLEDRDAVSPRRNRVSGVGHAAARRAAPVGAQRRGHQPSGESSRSLQQSARVVVLSPVDSGHVRPDAERGDRRWQRKCCDPRGARRSRSALGGTRG